MNEGPIMGQVMFHITLASWTQILLFVEMLKFLPQKMIFQKKTFCEENKESFAIFHFLTWLFSELIHQLFNKNVPKLPSSTRVSK
jgi:hypothetical protein